MPTLATDLVTPEIVPESVISIDFARPFQVL